MLICPSHKVLCDNLIIPLWLVSIAEVCVANHNKGWTSGSFSRLYERFMASLTLDVLVVVTLCLSLNTTMASSMSMMALPPTIAMAMTFVRVE